MAEAVTVEAAKQATSPLKLHEPAVPIIVDEPTEQLSSLDLPMGLGLVDENEYMWFVDIDTDTDLEGPVPKTALVEILVEKCWHVPGNHGNNP